MVLRICLLFVGLAPALAAAGSAEPPPLEPELIALCKSPDVAARRYCLRTIGARGDPASDARLIIARMADRDPELREEAAETYARLYGSAPPSQPPAEPPRSEGPKAPGDPMRVILAPTAFTRPEGTSSFNAFELGTLTFDHGFSPNLALGLQTAIPIGAFVLGPTMRVGLPFEGGAVGFHAQALLFTPFVGDGRTYLVAGGGPILTLGNYERYFNLGALAYFVAGEDGALLLPHAGFSLRVSRRVRVGAEVYVPGFVSGRSGDSAFGKLAILLWGLRLFGESVWGDIALAEPICGGCGDVYRTFPLGFPFLNLGVGW
jgi:hypothetical protein